MMRRSEAAAHNFDDLWRSYSVDRLIVSTWEVVRAELVEHPALESTDWRKLHRAESLQKIDTIEQFLHLCGVLEVGFHVQELLDTGSKCLNLLAPLLRDERLENYYRHKFPRVLPGLLLERLAIPIHARHRSAPRDWFSRFISIDCQLRDAGLNQFLRAIDGQSLSQVEQSLTSAMGERSAILSSVLTPQPQRSQAQTAIAGLESFLSFCREIQRLFDATEDVTLSATAFELYRHLFRGRRAVLLGIVDMTLTELMGGNDELQPSELPERAALGRLVERADTPDQWRATNTWFAAEQSIADFLSRQFTLHSRVTTLSDIADRKPLKELYVERQIIGPNGIAAGVSALTDYVLEVESSLVLLTSAAGTGKSWLLKYILMDLTRSQFPSLAPLYEDNPLLLQPLRLDPLTSRARIPIFITARNLDPEIPLVANVSRLTGLEPDVMALAFEYFAPVLLIDGLDELPYASRPAVEEQIRTTVSTNARMSCIVSTRPVNLSSLVDDADLRLELADFSMAEVNELLSRAGDPLTARFAGQYLARTGSETFRNPLFAQLALLAARHFAEVPVDQDQLLAQALDVLVYRHDSSKGAFLRHSVLSFGRDTFIAITGVIALLMVLAEKIQLTRTEFAHFTETSARINNIELLDSEDLQRELITIGLLVEFDNRILAFSHRSFLDYLAAGAAVRLAPSPQQMAQVLVRVTSSKFHTNIASAMARRWLKTSSQAVELLNALRTMAQSDPGDELSSIVAEIEQAANQLPNDDFAALFNSRL